MRKRRGTVRKRAKVRTNGVDENMVVCVCVCVESVRNWEIRS